MSGTDKKKETTAQPMGLVNYVRQSRGDNFGRIVHDRIMSQYEPFTSDGYVSLVGCEDVKVRILRDTGAAQSLILESALPFDTTSSAGARALLQGVGEGVLQVPLHAVNLKSDLVSGQVYLGVRKSLPVPGVSIILGNDLAGDKVSVSAPAPVVSEIPVEKENIETTQLVDQLPHVFPACAVTRAKARQLDADKKASSVDISLEDSFFCRLDEDNDNEVQEKTQSDSRTESSDERPPVVLNRSSLIEEQGTDSELREMSMKALSEDEALTVPVCYYQKNGVLMRKWTQR